MASWFQSLGKRIKKWWNGSILGSTINKYSGAGLTGQQQEQNEWNAEQAQINREWQSAESESNRRFQAKEAELAYDRQVDFYNTYQSPSAMVQQYKDAGLNPALMVGGSVGQTSVPSSSASSGSMPSSSPASGAPSAGSGDFIADILSILQFKKQMSRLDAETNKTNAEAKQIDKETSWIDTYNSASVDSMRAGIDKVRSDIDVNKSVVDKNIQDINESISRISVNDSTIQVNGALIDLHGSQTVLNECKSAVERMNVAVIKEMLPYIQARQEAEIALTNAKTDEARFSAEDKMYDANLKYLRALVDAKLIDSSYYDSVIDQAHWSAKSKKREYKWQPINDICHNLSMLMIGAGSVMSGVGGAASGLGQAAIVGQSLSPRNRIGY